MGLLEYFASSSIRLAAPLMIAALGLAVSERSGLINIGGEGVMIIGAFTAYTVSITSGSYWLGLLAAIPIGMLVMLVFAFASITLKVNQIVIGMGINLFGLGITSFLLRRFFRGEESVTATLTAPAFPQIAIPGLSKIPVLGPLLFNHNVLVYFSFLMVIILAVMFKRTSLGLRIISVGETPTAADSLGINVPRTRYMTALFSGAMLGIAGAILSIAQSNIFTENMTGGKGYIAMAVVVLGKWNPVAIFGGAVIFGMASALQLIIQNQGYNIPSHIVMTIPYIATLVAVLAMSRRRVNSPSALGIPFEK